MQINWSECVKVAAKSATSNYKKEYMQSIIRLEKNTTAALSGEQTQC